MNVLPWKRLDWDVPVGLVRTPPQYIPITDTWQDQTINWELVKIDALELSHRSVMWLLQGRQLSSLLIPNMDLDGRQFHIVLGSTWDPWRAPPSILNLKLARLGDIPDSIPDQKILELLAQQALKR
jgi:hypothetical protein